MGQEDIIKLLEKNKSQEYTIDQISKELGVTDKNTRNALNKLLSEVSTSSKIRIRESKNEKNMIKYYYSWQSTQSPIMVDIKKLNFTSATSDKLLYLILEEVREVNKKLGEKK